jgi:hypothetical protein
MYVWYVSTRERERFFFLSAVPAAAVDAALATFAAFLEGVLAMV